MKKITYSINKKISSEFIKKLYEDAGWYNYTKDISNLIKALNNSLILISAWDEENLVGLVRVVGDGYTIVYIQDILILKDYQRKGIGSELIKLVLSKFSNVRQKVLLTDDVEETRLFYEKLGFISCDKGEVVAFAKFN
jgi:ribosomal protein S18 acetylase RimI-like enzyme